MNLDSLSAAEKYLAGLINRERQAFFDYEKLGLARVEALLDAVGNPHHALAAVHITGSKGKGTVALATECLLRSAGCSTGTFTSPHLKTWLERFRIDGAPISVSRFLQTLNAIVPAIDRLRRDRDLAPSFFDVATALALRAFADARVDVAIVEVGIGGRLDSTNVVRPRVTVITTVQLEHTDKLGSTLDAIATEKAGILKPGVPALHGPLHPDALGAVLARSIAVDTDLEEVAARDVRQGPDGLRFALPDGRAVAIPLLGAPLATNLALAVRASEIFLDRALTRAELGALSRLELPARIERFGRFVLDSAHTPESARALRDALAAAYGPEKRWILVVSISADKDAAGVLAELAPAVRACIVTTAEAGRSLEASDLEPLAWAVGIDEVEAIPEPIAAVERAAALAGPDDGVVLMGSVYFAGAVRDRLTGEERWR